jgi:Protein of unknown function (DUF1524)
LYSEVRGYIDSVDRKTIDLLAELCDFGRAYRVVVGADPAETAVLRESYRRIDVLGITTAQPLLLLLRTLPIERLPTSEHERAVSAVESWIVRRLLVGANTRGYGKVFVDVLRSAVAAASASGVSIADAVVQALHGNPDRLSWPTDLDVKLAVMNRKAYNNMTQERIRLILGAIDEYMQRSNPKTEPAAFQYNALQIEHVMPQSWREHWPILAESEANRIVEAQQRDELIHRFGNLTLVTATFNKSVSNSAWTVKQPEFQGQSKLQLNGDIAIYTQWDRNEMVERSARLGELAIKVWPRPTQD